MAIYNLNNPNDYLKIFKEIEKYRENKQLIEIRKFHPVQTDKQQRYIHFMLSYFSWKTGDTFYNTLHTLQNNICPVVFYTGKKNKEGQNVFKPLSGLNTAEASSVIRNFIDYAGMNGIPIPEPEDKIGVEYCKKELESADGWI